MVHQPLDAPITRREVYQELVVVWLFIILTAIAGVGANSDWRALMVPVGALAILALHVIGLVRRSSRDPGGTSRHGGGAV